MKSGYWLSLGWRRHEWPFIPWPEWYLHECAHLVILCGDIYICISESEPILFNITANSLVQATIITIISHWLAAIVSWFSLCFYSCSPLIHPQHSNQNVPLKKLYHSTFQNPAMAPCFTQCKSQMPYTHLQEPIWSDPQLSIYSHLRLPPSPCYSSTLACSLLRCLWANSYLPSLFQMLLFCDAYPHYPI